MLIGMNSSPVSRRDPSRLVIRGRELDPDLGFDFNIFICDSILRPSRGVNRGLCEKRRAGNVLRLGYPAVCADNRVEYDRSRDVRDLRLMRSLGNHVIDQLLCLEVRVYLDSRWK